MAADTERESEPPPYKVRLAPWRPLSKKAAADADML
jgi:hypothetical protein